jgi:hypothetical protein
MTDLRDAARQALNSLRGYRREIGCEQPCDAERALEAALEQPEQSEPVARMAREAGYFLYDLTETHGKKTVETDDDDEWEVLARFAALVAAAAKEEMLMAGNDQWLEEARKAEREACAKLAESKASVGNASNYPTYIAAAIRARSTP